jgi:hypothetical protein
LTDATRKKIQSKLEIWLFGKIKPKFKLVCISEMNFVISWIIKKLKQKIFERPEESMWKGNRIYAIIIATFMRITFIGLSGLFCWLTIVIRCYEIRNSSCTQQVKNKPVEERSDIGVWKNKGLMKKGIDVKNLSEFLQKSLGESWRV